MKWTVSCTMPVFMQIDVEAETEEEAIDAAMPYAYLSSYAGNGAVSGKLIGTHEECVRLEPGECLLEGGPFSPSAEPAE